MTLTLRPLAGRTFAVALTDRLGRTVALVRYADEAERIQAALAMLAEFELYGGIAPDGFGERPGVLAAMHRERAAALRRPRPPVQAYSPKGY